MGTDRGRVRDADGESFVSPWFLFHSHASSIFLFYGIIDVAFPLSHLEEISVWCMTSRQSL